MIDAATPSNRLPVAGAPATRAPTLRLDIGAASGAEARAAYGVACADLLHAPPQGERWTRLWAETVNADMVFGRVARDGRPLFAIALEIVRQGPFRVARFPGGSHANGNFAPTDRAAPPLAADLDALFAAISKHRPDIDLFQLERMTPELDGLANPLFALPHNPHPNIGLAVNLDGGFDGVMSRASGKRKRKKHRSQARKFEARGATEVKRATDASDISRLLDIFFTIKADRLKRLGVSDVFADPAIRRFFKQVFGEAAEKDGGFVVDSLSVGGKVRALTGSSHCGDRLICEFSAIANDDLTFASPGEYLFFEMIAAACAEGKSVFDFSVGDEDYKRLWCDIETIYADIRRPTGFKGALLAGYLGGRAAVVRRLKADPRLWKMLKRLRRRDDEPASADDED